MIDFKIGDRVICINPERNIPIISIPLNEHRYCIIYNKKGRITKKEGNLYIVKFDDPIEIFPPLKDGRKHLSRDDSYAFLEASALQLLDEYEQKESINMPLDEEKFSKKKEKFKIDKLGWYKSEEGRKYKVVHISKNKSSKPIFAFNEDDDDWNNFELNGEGYITNLIEYIGPELLKDPREFKEICFFKEYGDLTLQSIDDILCETNYPKEKVDFSLNKKNVGAKFSKWEITAKEIIE